ncbi:MAG TPA: LuxR C-terminal-related transcriptional regulator [Bryobacteraceae bacterium]|jgi:DNA-binding CsgD family transcriptional regulator
MQEKPRRWALRPYTDKELRVVELRTHGVQPKEIARMLGISRTTVFHRLSSVYRKAGFSDVALLTRWAIANAMDEPAPADTPETAAVPEPKKRKARIRLGRLGRLGRYRP